ncbi:Bug family tripartite tricarboxylate transporter substrate binding protein [Variovorax sp. RHLX14]|uniref:Bug family tripartite tricarboxylate transporter substrate binding protein n=1 Tax=unclassified Variovorax TaxID=663243 RepID=UPI003F470BE5
MQRKPTRGTVSRRLFVTATLLLPAMYASAQSPADTSGYPSRPIRLVVGFPPGQSSDVIARAYAAALQPILKAAIYIDNKPGANGILAAQTVKSAEPDGYTLLFGTSGQLAINPALYAKLPYSPSTDFVPVAPIARGRLFLVVNNDLPVSSLKELVAYSKANPGKLSFGSGGTGITSHLAMEMLKSATGLNAVHVPYKGSPAALAGLMGGDVQLMFDSGGSLLPLVASGKVKALAVSTKDRYPALPNLQTVQEQGAPGFEAYAWNAVLAPARTPEAIVRKLNAAFLEASRSEMVTAPVATAAHDALQMDLPQLGEFMRAETVRWGKSAAAAGVKPE